jgi:hypothetical protein
MNCKSVVNLLSAHIDGLLAAEEQRALLLHVGRCSDCAVRLEQVARVRRALRGLPARTPPQHLTTMLRVAASRERERTLARRKPFEYVTRGFRLWAENLMRPIALPFAGGLVSAVLLFSMLIPTFALRRPITDREDIPNNLFTEPTIKASMPFGFDGDVDVEALVDDQGRMVNYTILSGPNTIEVRRAIENNLLFTEFTPATSFGTPTYGKINIRFQRSTIDIKS